MFTGSYFPASYWPPNYFPKTGAEAPAPVGGGTWAAGLRLHLMEMAASEDARRQEQVYHRYRAARDAAARLSFELAMVRLRNFEEEARRQMMLQRAMVATFLAEV